MAAPPAATNYKMTLIAGVKGDEFYITMNCGAQAEAEKQGVDLDFQGPDQFDASLQTPIVNGVIAKKPRRDPDRAHGRQGDVRPDQAGGRRRHQDRARRHDARERRHGGLADRVRQRRWRQGRRQGAGRAIGGSGQVFVNNVKPGISTTDQRAQGFEEEAKNLGLEYVGHGVQPGPAGQGGGDHEGRHRQVPGPEGHLRARTCSGPRAPRSACASPATRPSRSSASTRVPSRSRTSRRASCRRSWPRSPPTSAPRASSRPSPR